MRGGRRLGAAARGGSRACRRPAHGFLGAGKVELLPERARRVGPAARRRPGSAVLEDRLRVDPTRFLLLAAAALAILLVGLAAVPPTALADARLATLVEERRTELALAGAMRLLAAVLVYSPAEADAGTVTGGGLRPRPAVRAD